MTKASKHQGLSDLLSASAIFGAIPAATLLSGGDSNPFLFVAFWNLGNVVISIIYLSKKYPDLLKSKLLGQIRKEHFSFKPIFGDSNTTPKVPSIFNIFGSRSILIFVNNARFLLFAWSLKYVHTVVATVLFEIWPIFFVILFGKISNNEYYFTKRTIILSSATFLATALIVFSNTSGSVDSTPFNFEYIFGLFLLISVLILILQNSGILFKSKQIAKNHFANSSPLQLEHQELGVRMLLNLFNATIGSLIGFIGFGIFKAFNIFQEFAGIVNIRGIVFATILGATLSFFGLLLSARGTLRSKDLRIHAVRYLTPVFGVLFVFTLYPLKDLFSGLSIEIADISSINWSWFIAGFLGILSINVLINFKTEERRFGLTSLVVTLWLSGVLVFFRDEWNWWSNSINLIESGIVEYYGFLGAVATIFALLIGFEINRVEQRTAKEEEGVFALLQRLNMLYPSDTKIQKYLEDLDTATNSNDIKKQYLEISKKLEGDLVASREEHNPSEGRVVFDDNSLYLSDTISKLNTVAHSKQQGRGIAESIAIVLLAGFTIVLSFALRPSGTEGFIAILVDSFGFLLAGVVAYLVFHLYDLRSSRTGSIMEKKDSEWYRVEFQDSGTRGEAAIASILVAVIVVTYFVLFSLKWLL